MVLREIHSASHQILKAEEKKKMLRKYPFFKLEVVVGSGRDLIAMDRGGKTFLLILELCISLFNVAPAGVQTSWNCFFKVQLC